MLRPADVLLLGAALLAVLFFIGGLVDVFSVPVNPGRRRPRNPVRRRQKPGSPRRAELLEEWVEVPETRAAARLTFRFLNLAAGAILLALILGAFVLRDGGAVSIQPRPERLGLSGAQQAKALTALGDYEGARKLYQEALRATPGDVSLWYALGVTLSHLDHRKEAEETFHFVVRHGRPDSEEVRVARRWLVSAGVLPRSETFTTASPVSHAAEHAAVVHGKVIWDGLEPSRPPLEVRILLHGLSGAAEGKRFSERVALGQGYRFEGLPSGSYRLIGRVAGGALLWDQRIDVEEGKEIAFDLSKENSRNPKDAPS
jgi:tetratricopeptide (TPR) repeat protein